MVSIDRRSLLVWLIILVLTIAGCSAPNTISEKTDSPTIETTNASLSVDFRYVGETKEYRDQSLFALPYGGHPAVRNGSVWVTDCSRRTLTLFDSEGKVQKRIVGRSRENNITFGLPADVALNSSGFLFVVDELKDIVWVLSPNGSFVTSFGQTGNNSGEFVNPLGVAIGPNDTIYVVDSGNHRIQHFSSDFEVLDVYGSVSNSTTVASSSRQGFRKPYYADVTPSGVLIVVDRGNHRLKAITPNGSVKWILGNESAKPGSGMGEFNHPHEVSVDPSGRIFVSDTNNNRIQIINVNGTPIGVINTETLNPQPKVATITPRGTLFTASVGENRSLQRWKEV